MNRLHIYPHFEEQLTSLLDGSFPGNSFQDIIVRDFQCSSANAFEEHSADHFKIHLPYAGFTLVWEVQFDACSPEQAPDFLFDDDAFTQFLDVNILTERVPSLVNWDVKTPGCLRSVLQELMNLYTMYQLQRLEKEGSSLSKECSKLMQQFELEENQLQVLSGDAPILPHYFGSSTRPNHSVVSVMILHIEKKVLVDDIPEHYRQMALHFLVRDYGNNNVALHISPTFGELLGQSDMEIPCYNRSDNLSDYFQSILRITHETLVQVSENYDKRQEFHLGIYHELMQIDLLHITPAEIDFPICTASSYIIEIDGYPMTAKIHTPSNSSGDPKIFIRSLTGKVHDIRTDAPWDVQKTSETIVNYVADLKDDNTDSLSL